MSATSSLIHDLPRHTVRRAVVSSMANNIYLITAKDTGAQVLIDAADELPAINKLFQDATGDAAVPTSLAMIATTHQHWDHVRALAALVEQTGTPTAAGAEDVAGIISETGVATSHALADGGTLAVDGIELATVHLRGHTPGSIAFVLQEADTTLIFSGDSLFPGGIGNTGESPQRFTSLLNDVQDRLFNRYADDAVVLPGHGNATTLGAERPSLPQWRQRGW
ncbi:MBL fold metallo-hydrolase [Arthrobacter sp.]|uniref:MBL fold metallo-hydrolase n=1 Tax=Arthrobacter sp. TaxID=1667 RepID=UPI0026E01A8F|nr:MBL fold metallo-hydrolase [Arthrobacter sp.]MDO5754182.1 MBL fold metallo-hydrolase [Arthrobacter sp.]